MKDQARPAEGGWYRCINPKCGKVLIGRKSHCKTCSPACRKALWRHGTAPKKLPKSGKRPPTLKIPGKEV